MDQLVQSIKERGIITPVTLRPKENGRYEIVSGHRRKKACELAGFDTVKAEVRDMFRRKNDKRIVELNSEDLRLAKHALLEFRNKLIAEGKPTEDVNALLLKIMK